jgi:hypothetical protein
MAPFIEQPRPEHVECFEPLAMSRPNPDIPGRLADRVGSLYAAAERADRIARTERLIRRAEALQ